MAGGARPSNRFRCPICGFAFAPAYATVALRRGRRVMAAQAALVTALAELGSMTGDRLRLDQAAIVDPIANTLPEVKAKQLGLARRHRAHWVGPRRCHSPPNHLALVNRLHERSGLLGA